MLDFSLVIDSSKFPDPATPYLVGDPAWQLTWAPTDYTVTEQAECGAVQWSVTNSNDTPINSVIFTASLSTNPLSLSTYT